jgi:uncharacterized membrane protein HdeD (DUF308 family)
MAEVAANPPAFGKAEPHLYPWWLLLIEGIAAILIGIFFFMTPGITAATVAFFVALYWMITGIVTLVSLFWDRTQWGWKLVWGIISVIAGWWIIGNLLLGTATLIWVYALILGIQGLIIGIVELVQAFQGAGWGRGALGAISVLFGGWIMYMAIGRPVQIVVIFAYAFAILAIVGGIAAIFFAFQVRGMEKSATPRGTMGATA